MSTIQINSVNFKGSAKDLHELIGCWNVMRGVQWAVKPADYVGGCFNVTFTRQGAAPITQQEAMVWLETALENSEN